MAASLYLQVTVYEAIADIFHVPGIDLGKQNVGIS